MFRNFHRRLQLDESVFQALNVDKKRSLTLALGRAYNTQWRTLACEPARTTVPGMIYSRVKKRCPLQTLTSKPKTLNSKCAKYIGKAVKSV